MKYIVVLLCLLITSCTVEQTYKDEWLPAVDISQHTMETWCPDYNYVAFLFPHASDMYRMRYMFIYNCKG